MAVFEGFIKRVWGHLGIVQISRMTLGLTLVKFNDEATRDHVLENGVLQFDRKPVIMRPWTADLSAIRLIRSVSLWIRLHDLGLQYWGSKCISALVSTIGKPLLVDKFTKDRSRVQFARVLVEMEITYNPPHSFQFINEHGQVVEQGIEYEWLPTKCKSCSGFGHTMADCRKEHKIEALDKGKGDPSLSVETNPGLKQHRDVKWLTPKRVSSQRQGQGAGSSSMAVAVHHQKNQGLNKVNKQGYVQEVFKKNNIGISGLLETKLRGKILGEFMEHKFPNWEFYSSLVTEGRLLILWRKGIARLSILEDTPQLVHCQVNWVGHQEVFFVSFVYGFNSVENRRSLWQDLTRISGSVKAWLVLGDFNAPFSGGDRSGGSVISSSELADSIDWKNNAKTEAIKSIGSFFTWTNNQAGLARIYSKIDHAFINEEWLDKFPQCMAVFQWEVVSDHCSCLISNFPLKLMGTKLFRFFNFWVNHPDFNHLVMESWRVPVLATGLKAIFIRLIRLKHQLKKLNRDRFGDIGACYQSALERKADNSIVSVINEQGLLVDNGKEVVDHFVKHFQNHLGSSSSATGIVNQHSIATGSKLSVDQQLYLLNPFTVKEIRAALFNIPSTKSPGPDGYGSGFFKPMWKDIGQDICSAIQHGFSSGQFPKDLHETTLSLIPKVVNPARASDYIPIACCSTLYKVMAKLLCSRLAVVLPSLIQSNQGVFVRGRCIAHNIMILQDLIKNYGRALTSPRCAIKIDLSKAYDTVDW
ncbi:uncharacterized protein LOC133831972 [Humulus lupulus]|uniref:uncharacterized protein LOC133831972 n=1 Tax=Humulus lupulus TaxID=3486 RepID=UPI002B40FBF2|nr:uncharacterized protein LOC133831972 [Humulus lupulus]